MEDLAGRILKGDQVKLEGRFHLDVVQAETDRVKGKNVTSATPQVSIVENHPEFAVIEITCSCGTKTCLRCEYDRGQSPASDSETQNGAIGVPNQEPDQVPDQEPDQTK